MSLNYKVKKKTAKKTEDVSMPRKYAVVFYLITGIEAD